LARTASGLHLFVRYWLPALLYVAAIVMVSAQPQLRPPVQFQSADKWYHLIEYFGLGLVMVRAIRASLGYGKLLTSAFLALGIGIVLAIGDELFQSTVPGRTSSHLDVMADVAGLVCAQLVYMWFAKE